MPGPYVHELRVRWGECDPQSIVFNANYYLYFDVAFTELWRDAVGPWEELSSRGIEVVLAEASARFLAAARFDEWLRLEATLTRIGTTSTTTAIDVIRGDEVLVKGELRHVFVDASEWSKTAIPAWARDGLARFAAPDGESQPAC